MSGFARSFDPYDDTDDSRYTRRLGFDDRRKVTPGRWDGRQRSVPGAGESVNNTTRNLDPWSNGTFKSVPEIQAEQQLRSTALRASGPGELRDVAAATTMMKRANTPTPAPPTKPGSWIWNADGTGERVMRSSTPGGGVDVLEKFPPPPMPGQTATGVSHPEREFTPGTVNGTQFTQPPVASEIISRFPAIGVLDSPENKVFREMFTKHGDWSKAMADAEAAIAANQAPPMKPIAETGTGDVAYNPDPFR